MSWIQVRPWGLPRTWVPAGSPSPGVVGHAIIDRHRHLGPPSGKQFRADLEPLAPVYRWTSGAWEFGADRRRKWDEVQNTPKEVRLLVDYLTVQYKALVWNRATT